MTRRQNACGPNARKDASPAAPRRDQPTSGSTPLRQVRPLQTGRRGSRNDAWAETRVRAGRSCSRRSRAAERGIPFGHQRRCAIGIRMPPAMPRSAQRQARIAARSTLIKRGARRQVRSRIGLVGIRWIAALWQARDAVGAERVSSADRGDWTGRGGRSGCTDSTHRRVRHKPNPSTSPLAGAGARRRWLRATARWRPALRGSNRAPGRPACAR